MPEKQVTNEALASIEGIRSSMEHFQGRREGHEQVRKGMMANIWRFMSVFFGFPQQLLYAWNSVLSLVIKTHG